MLDLDIIDQERLKIMEFVLRICGTPSVPRSLEDEKQKISAQENILALKGLKKAIVDHFAPLKAEAKKPWQDLINQENEWVEAIEKPIKFIDLAISDFNQKERERLNAIRQAEKDEEVRKEREKKDAQAQEALKIGNTELAAEIEMDKRNIIAEVVPDSKIVTKSEMTTSSESESIDEFKIMDHVVLARAMMDTGKESMIVLDKKVETAMKKWLINNPGVKDFPGIYFKRAFKNNYKAK